MFQLNSNYFNNIKTVRGYLNRHTVLMNRNLFKKKKKKKAL